MRVLIAHASTASRSILAGAVTRGRRLALEVVTAADGPEAVELLLADDPPEIALVDWDLPEIEAPEMCRLVRDFQPHHDTWMIVLTSPAHRESAGEVWRAGADDCVFTPAPAKLLSERVTKGLCEMTLPVRDADADETVSQPPRTGTRPTLDAVCREDADDGPDEPAGLSADLTAVVDAEGPDDPAELAATPAELAAERLDCDERDGAARGRAALEAVVVAG